MAVQVEDVLSVNVVFVGIELLKTPSEVATCSAAIDREFVLDGAFLDPSSPTGPVPGRILRLPKERITVDTSAIRSKITKEYPAAIEDVASVAKVAAQAVSVTSDQDLVASAHGFNISMVYNNESHENAIQYLGRRIFAPPAFLTERWSSVGGYGRLKFKDEMREWTVTLEPRHQNLDTSKVFLDINLHMPVQGPPPVENEMHHNLKELWEYAHTLIEAIDSNVDN